MTPFLADPDVTVYQGDALETLRGLPPCSVHMACTSPPFYGLRDYGTGSWEGGDEGCDHLAPPIGGAQAGSPNSTLSRHGPDGVSPYVVGRSSQYRNVCGKCGARRIDRQIGLEETPQEWCDRLVEVFREVRRVLRDDGTLWVEIGDSYAQGGSGAGVGNTDHADTDTSASARAFRSSSRYRGQKNPRTTGGDVKQKDLLGQPWLLAFALRADGWYLRSEIIWARPNPMPESVTDRPTKAHSTVFLLSKQPRYFYDAEAVREPHAEPWRSGTKENTRRGFEDGLNTGKPHMATNGRDYNPAGANARSVWTIPTEPTPFAHFATWPQALCRRMILAGTSERGVCPECGAPWVREVERGELVGTDRGGNYNGTDLPPMVKKNPGTPGLAYENTTVGWRPSCDCGGLVIDPPMPIPATVLDPFGGSGTTAIVARKLGRRAILVELSPDYCQLASRRLSQQSLFAEAGA